MKTKSFTLMIASVLALVMIVSLASASGTLTITNTSAIPSTINPGESIIVDLNLTYSGTASGGVDLTWTAVNPTIGAGFWTLPTLSHIDNTTSLLTSFTFLVPANYAPGIINAELQAKAGTATPDSFTFPITVNTVSAISVSDSIIASGANSTTVTIKNEGNTVLTNIALTDSGDFDLALSTSTIATLAAGASTTITATVNENIDDLIGPNTAHITATSGTISDSGAVTLNANYCEYSDNGNLDVSIDDITVTGYGDETDWFPLDNIEMDILVENNGDEKIKNIVVEWGLYDTTTGDWYIKDKESDFNLNDGDDKTITINFDLKKHVEDLENGNYVFYVRATGEDVEFDDNKTCISDSNVIDVQIESDFVIAYNVQIPTEATCGETIQLTADIWNIGDTDQDDVQVKLVNADLGINKLIDISRIKSFKSESISFDFTVPTNLKEGYYPIKITVYDEDGSVFQNDYDDDDSIKTSVLKVAGACTNTGSAKASITASLESEAKAGQPLTIKATITNIGSTTTTFTIQSSDYATWSTLGSQDKTTLVLEAGKSEDVIFTFNVNKDVSGAKSFKVSAISADGKLAEQSLSITIEPTTGFFSRITGNAISGDNWYFWGIGLLNVILVVAIIIVVVRIFRK